MMFLYVCSSNNFPKNSQQKNKTSQQLSSKPSPSSSSTSHYLSSDSSCIKRSSVVFKNPEQWKPFSERPGRNLSPSCKPRRATGKVKGTPAQYRNDPGTLGSFKKSREDRAKYVPHESIGVRVSSLWICAFAAWQISPLGKSEA